MQRNKFEIEKLTRQLVEYLMKNDDMDLMTALNSVYNSETYKQILDPNSKIPNNFSSEKIYQILRNEIKFGRMIL